MNISKLILNTFQQPFKLSVRFRINPNSRKLLPCKCSVEIFITLYIFIIIM